MVSGIDSANLKLDRAAEHLKTINDRIEAYATDDPYEIVKEPDGKEGVRILRDPPPDIPILIGEMVYQIRSALDHLAFDLVKLNANVSSLDPEWFEHCEFPLRTKLRPGQNPPLPQGGFCRVLPGISKQAFAFIESMQPYYRRDYAPWNNAASLGALAELSNIDKHRHLILTPARLSHSELVALSSGSHRYSRTTLDDGAELKPVLSLQEMAQAVRVERSFCLYVLFDERALGKAAQFTIHHILQTCLNTAQGVIVPAFEKFI